MAGSKTRHNIHGHVVMGEASTIRLLHRLSTGELTQIFMHAKEQGQILLTLDDEQYTLLRHSDHTFSLEPGSAGHLVL